MRTVALGLACVAGAAAFAPAVPLHGVSPPCPARVVFSARSRGGAAHSYGTRSLVLAFSPQNTQVARASSFTPSLRTASTARAATMPTLRSGKATPAITMMAKKSVKDLKDTELKGKKVGSPLAAYLDVHSMPCGAAIRLGCAPRDACALSSRGAKDSP